MKQKDMATLVTTAVVSAIFAFIISGFLFSTSRHTKVPQAESITTSFPDVRNDATYNSIFNSDSLDFAQPVIIGGSQNNTPFNSANR